MINPDSVIDKEGKPLHLAQKTVLKDTEQVRLNESEKGRCTLVELQLEKSKKTMK